MIYIGPYDNPPESRVVELPYNPLFSNLTGVKILTPNPNNAQNYQQHF